ncbi:MAG: NlpC/P60 family protein [Abditibacteriales bacterium]|nr:NlpC/P60 family protein [Abditibacteriales bacterium]MDW8366304.1 NlpC/P60 family protein [Abditibacteriales bacterium]
MTTEVLNVRKQPAIAGHRVVALVQGAQVKVLGKRAGFYKIKTKKGIVGWVLWKYLEADRPEQVAMLSPAPQRKPRTTQVLPAKRGSSPLTVAVRQSQSTSQPRNRMTPTDEKSQRVPLARLKPLSVGAFQPSAERAAARQTVGQQPAGRSLTKSVFSVQWSVVIVDPATYDFLRNLDTENSAPVVGSTELPKRLAKLLTTPSLASRPLVESVPVVADSEMSTKGRMLVDSAMAYRGIRYRRGASLPSRGFDCSGLVYHILKSYGMKSPRTAAELFRLGTRIKKEQLKEGDLVFFANTYKRGISHVGIYIGGGRFIHASSRGGQVMVNSLDEEFYAKHYAGARRIVKE